MRGGWPVLPGVIVVLAVLAVEGCGPGIVPAGAASASAEESTTTMGDPTGHSASDTHGAVTTTTSPPATTTLADGTSTGTDDIEDSTTGPFMCGCPEDTPIDFDTELRAGFTPAAALAPFQGLSIPLDWVAYEGTPATVLHADAAYVGGAITEGPGGDDGCLFLNSPCNDGVIMEVELTLTTEDGALDWTTPARIMGDPASFIEVDTNLQNIGGNTGTLASWPLQVRGIPFVIAELTAAVSYDPDGPFVRVVGWSAERDSLLLGTDE